MARELERQWDAALHECQALEQEYARFRQSQPTRLSDNQQAAVRSLAENVPAVWHSPDVENADRRRIIRLLVERVEVVIEGTTDRVDVSLRWSGGFVSRHELLRPVRRYDLTADFEGLIAQDLGTKSIGALRTPRSLRGSTTRNFDPRIRPRNSTARLSADWPEVLLPS